MNETLQLIESKHPDKKAEEIFENLIGIDKQKEKLVSTISFLLDKEKIAKWVNTHHRSDLPLLDRIVTEMPLIILAGEVGCGKSALANSVGTPIAKQIDRRLTCFETPSDIRGNGRVGELSARITSAFTQAKAKLSSGELGILIIDEADDLATSRSQNQAHHEDRAGLNVLVKQLDLINREKVNITVILITNRIKVLDPAIMRRASLQLTFKRPNDEERKKVFQYIFRSTKTNEIEFDKLVEASKQEKIPFSYSDLINRIAKQAVIKAVRENKPFDASTYLDVLSGAIPSPLIE